MVQTLSLVRPTKSCSLGNGELENRVNCKLTRFTLNLANLQKTDKTFLNIQ